VAAAVGLAAIEGCDECGKLLHEQYEQHPDSSVRTLIGLLLGVPYLHKH
jgi:hypothetical protein